jgi:hypothetical protein
MSWDFNDIMTWVYIGDALIIPAVIFTLWHSFARG